MTTSFELPHAAIPVRGRTTAHCAESAAAVTALLLAGVVTGGTVMVRESLPLDDDAARALRAAVASTGAYVVASADGLTATTRATAGELPPFRCTVPADVLPLYAVAAARAADDCVLSCTDSAATEWLPVLRQIGITARGAGTAIVVSPGIQETAGVVAHGGDVRVVLTALLAALIRPGTRIVDTAPLDAALPGFLDCWNRLLAADEYLLPGSALVPSDYTAPTVRTDAPEPTS
ncbi:hypothetical protein TVH25_00400 [Rhodococcus sp. 7Tela_A2]|uniref:hypothetical protein n=1 Tax=Rhodococcus sp. 7Tela_A2 TaxID=3093744 RepID=UPI003BB6516B